MLIPPPFPNPVSQHCPLGLLAIPDLPWVAEIPPLALEDATSLRAMYSFLQGRGYQEVLDEYLPGIEVGENLNPEDINTLETSLVQDIDDVIAAGDLGNHDALAPIAIGIQLWGGKMGRKPFLGSGFHNNFPLDSYGQLIETLMELPPNVPLTEATWAPFVGLKHQFWGVGPSFLTKHLAFWSRAQGAPVQLPILDSRVKATFLDPRNPLPKMDDYPIYHQNLTEDCAALQALPHLGEISMHAVERQLFNFTNSDAANAWRR